MSKPLFDEQGITITNQGIFVQGKKPVQFRKIMDVGFVREETDAPLLKQLFSREKGSVKFKLTVFERRDVPPVCVFETEDAALVDRITKAMHRALLAYKGKA